MLSAQEKETLDDIFYSKDLMMKGFESFRQATKHLNLPLKKLDFYYNNQEVVQLFRPIKSRRQRLHIPITSFRPFQRVYFDTMFITGLNLTFINAIDLFSKYGFSKSFRGTGSSSSKARQTLEEFLKDIMDKGYYIETIRCDPGSEFQAEFKSTCDDLGIDLKYTDPKNKKQTSPIESFNRSIRLSIEKLRVLLKNDNPVISQVEKSLDDIVKSYNNAVHSKTGYSPIDVLTSKSNQDAVLVSQVLRKTDIVSRSPILLPGYTVRIAIESGPFSKLSPTWSKEIYTIKKFDEKRNRYSLEEKTGYYDDWQLQVIDREALMKHTVKRYISKDAPPDVFRAPRSDVDKNLVVEGKRERRAPVRNDDFEWI